MKKFMVGMIVSCMLLNGTAVFAEEAVELKWEDMVALNEAAEVDVISQGRFVVFDEIDCQMWVPNVMQEVELTDEDVENGYIGYYATEEQDAVAAVMYVDMGGEDLDSYKEYLEGSDDVQEVSKLTINGIEAVSYDIPERDTTCLSFATQAGYILEFSFAPMSDENYKGTIAFMGASIQPADSEGAEETEEAGEAEEAEEAEE